MKELTRFLLTFISCVIVLSTITFMVMYYTVNGHWDNMPDKYTVHILNDQYIGNTTDYNFATHENDYFENVLMFNTTQLCTGEKFGDYIHKNELSEFNSSEWHKMRDVNLYFANEHTIANHVHDGDTIIVRWVFDDATQQYAVKGVINETELNTGDY
jgi:trehalose-6-phosphate synthase